jgi:WD40 repeat protein/energy-coupling factor transporter ATP-binding protein EcfA2
MMGSQNKPYDLFISYAGADRAWAQGYLLDGLHAAGVRCLTQGDFSLGARWTEELEGAVAQSDRVLLVLSRAYLADNNQRLLDDLARYHELKTNTASVIPLLLDEVELPLGLESKVSLRAITDEEKAQAVERLAAACRAGAPEEVPLPCPYPGMAAFDRRNARLFHGRQREVADLLQELRHRRCLFLIGRSGSGKSSLVLAGLLPHLEQGRTVHVMRPGATPATTLAALTASDTGKCLLVVDQFEEVYTRATAEEAGRFEEALCAWVGGEERVLLVTVRSDFYPDMQDSPAIFPLFQANHRDVLPLGREALREAIVSPAAGVGVFVEPALVERLLADAAGEPCVLPHLQETMQLLWERRRRRYLPLEAYQELGRQARTGLQQAMAVVADAAVDTLRPEEQAIARRIFLRLVQFGEGREDSRRQQPLSALESAADPVGPFERVLARLILRRLVVPDLVRVGTTETTVIDLAHEALITGWPKLQGWVLESREAEQTRRRLEGHATEWVRLGRGTGGLFDEVELHEAEGWFSRHGSEMGATEELGGLVAASREAIVRKRKEEEAAREQRVRAAEEMAEVQRRRAEEQATAAKQLRRRLVAAGCLALAAMVAAGVAWDARQWALHEKQKAERATADAKEKAELGNSRRLAALAHGQRLDANLDVALLLAIQACQVETVEARDSLLTCLQAAPLLECWLAKLGVTATSVAFSPDGKALASAGRDGSIRLWDVAERRPRGEPLRQKGSVSSVAFSPDGKVLASGGADGSVRLWDVAEQRQLGEPLRGHATTVSSVAFSPDGKALASGGWLGDASIRLWDVAQRRQRGKPLLGHKKAVSSLAFSPDGKALASAGWVGEGSVRLWDVAQQRQWGEPLPSNKFAVSSVAFSPDSKALAAGGAGGTICLWDVEGRQQLGQLLLGQDSNVWSVAFSPDGKALASGDAGGAIRLWDFEKQRQRGQPMFAHKYGVNSVAFSRDGKRLASAGWGDGGVCLWDMAERWQLGESLSSHEEAVRVVFNPESSILASATARGSICFWDVAERRQWGQPMLGHKGAVLGIVFTPDSKLLVSGGEDGSIRLWDVAQQRQRGQPILSNQVRVQSVALERDGKALASAGDDGTVRLWDLAERRQLGEPLLHGKYAVFGVAFSPDGKVLVSGGADGSIRLWDVAQQRQRGQPLLGHTEAVVSVVFSPDGKALASAGVDGTVRLWDVAEQRQLGEPLRGHTTTVSSVAFSPDGKALASGGRDGTIRLWDMEERRQWGQLLPWATGDVWSVAFNRDGSLLASGSDGKPIRLWDLRVQSWIARARAIVNRELSPEERRLFLITSPD